MLILTRRRAESIFIGEEITITVLGVVGNQVRFGIEAPRHIAIDRAEIHERKKRAANGNGALPQADPAVSPSTAVAAEPAPREEPNGNGVDK